MGRSVSRTATEPHRTYISLFHTNDELVFRTHKSQSVDMSIFVTTYGVQSSGAEWRGVRIRSFVRIEKVEQIAIAGNSVPQIDWPRAVLSTRPKKVFINL